MGWSESHQNDPTNTAISDRDLGRWLMLGSCQMPDEQFESSIAICFSFVFTFTVTDLS